jgi:hypothetical protein
VTHFENDAEDAARLADFCRSLLGSQIDKAAELGCLTVTQRNTVTFDDCHAAAVRTVSSNPPGSFKLSFWRNRLYRVLPALSLSERRRTMVPRRIAPPRFYKFVIGGLMLVALLTVGSIPFFSRDRVKNETIEASAMGTSTQLGQVVGISVEIYDFSTPEDRQVLVEAFEKGQNNGLVNALSKMRAVGHCSITGTLGYDVSFIRMIPTPTGRKIRWITNRLLRYGEVYADTQSQSFNLTAGEFDINDTDKSKSTGVLYPACQLALDKEGQIQFQLNQNPWKLVDIIDWKGTAGVN